MKTSKEVFEALNKFFNDPNVVINEKYQTWDALSALRGPDFQGSGDVKYSITAVLRWRLVGSGVSEFVDSFPDSIDKRELRVQLLKNDTIPSHFLDHARGAFRALGLSWDYVND